VDEGARVAGGQFGRAVEPLPDVQTRKMFGYPAAFTGGQMFAGLFQSSMMLRLSAEDRARFVAEHDAKPFEPMPGRVMREYVVVPEAVLGSERSLKTWLGKARDYAASLPPKRGAAKTGRKKRTPA
jgi:TfoX/Sxy family transcriptional regulator of competence genes